VGLHVRSILPLGEAPPVLASGASQRAATGPGGATGVAVGKLIEMRAELPRPEPATGSEGPGWEGINSSRCTCLPPDTSLAVGTEDLVELTNAGAAIWSANGTTLATENLTTFFDVPSSTGLEQPAIIFDNLSGDWYAVAVDSGDASLVVVASRTASLFGGWMEYLVPAYRNERPDLPSIGASEWMVGIATNDYNETTQNLDGTGYILLNRTELGSGGLAYYETNPEYWDPNGRAENAVTASPTQWFGGMEDSPRGVFWLNWSNAPPAAPSFSNGYATVSPFSASPPAAQPGTVDLLNTSDGGDARATSALWWSGLETLTFSTGTGCSGSESCLGLVQVWTVNGTLRQDLLITSASDDLFYPSASADARGDLTVVAGFSSTTTYPSAYMFGQAWNEPNSTSLGSFVVANGSASVTSGCNAQSVCPYGSEFGSAPQPNTSTIWTASEYTTGATNWSTWIHAAATFNVSLRATAFPARIDLGEVADISTISAGGTSRLSNFVWSGLPPGCSTADVPELYCSPTVAGNYVVTVEANDTYPRSATATVPLLVAPPPIVGLPYANGTTADAGQYRSFFAYPGSGVGPYGFQWAGLPAVGCNNTTTARISCLLPSPGNLSVAVTVTDAVGESVTSPVLTYLVYPTLRIVGINATNYLPQYQGSTVEFTAAVVGGSGGDVFRWSTPTGGCEGVSKGSIVCRPQSPGSFPVVVSVTDSNEVLAISPTLDFNVTWPAGSPIAPWFADPELWAAVGLAGGTVIVAIVVIAKRRGAGANPDDPAPEDADLDETPRPPN
jgi:hypothetical protein